jgi:hypothetical protein
MFNLLLIYDDLNQRNGDYFTASHQNIVDKLSVLDISNLQSLNTTQCLTYPIDHYSRAFNGQPFVFMAYTHGSEDALHVGDNQYIHEQNAYLFSETLFYACSCLSAKTLGLRLRHEGCKIFAGYDAKISSANPELDGLYIECENAFLSNFLTTNNTIQASLNFMYNQYEAMRSHLRSEFNAFALNVLEDNLNAFKLFCSDEDRELTNLYFRQ